MNEPRDPEQTALESLVSAILHQFSPNHPVSDDEVDEFIKNEYVLSDEQRKALANLGDPRERMKKDPPAIIVAEQADPLAPELAGMYRHSSDEQLDAHTKQLIEQKR